MAVTLDEIRSLYERRVRIEPSYPGSHVERGERTVRLVEGNRGWVSWSDLGGLDLAEVDRIIAGEIARFRELGVLDKLEWKLFGSDRPAELRQRLEAQGFVPSEPADAILVLDLYDLPPTLAELADPRSRAERGYDIRRMPGHAGLEDMRRIMEEIWPGEADDTIEFVKGALEADPDGHSIWLAFVEGQAVSEGRIEFACGEFAGIWGGATLPAFRRRGIYTALVAARAAEALERGCRFLTIDASPMSRAVLEKRGFRLLDTALECNYKGS
jgi:GNAT superfamily N-acetyltransferase